eukprot:m.168960 g.168960  ORF g.168960 m.168960 type:complete len:347 (-) comp13031_c0_seq1:792-1832(-)
MDTHSVQGYSVRPLEMLHVRAVCVCVCMWECGVTLVFTRLLGRNKGKSGKFVLVNPLHAVLGRWGENGRLAREISIEIGRNTLAFSRLKRRLDPTGINFVPVNAREKRMLLHVRLAGGTGPQALCWVFHQQVFHIRHGLFAEPGREQDRILQNGRKEFIFRRSIKGRLPRQHFIRQHPQCPPVHRKAIRDFTNNLRRNVIRRAAKGCGRVVFRAIFFAHAKIGNLNMAVIVQHHIVQLKVTVDYPSLVHKEQPRRNLGAVKPRAVFLEPPRLLNLKQKVASLDKLHDIVETVRCLEAPRHLGQVRVEVCLREHILLRNGTLDVIVLNKNVLLENLDGENLLCFLVL